MREPADDERALIVRALEHTATDLVRTAEQWTHKRHGANAATEIERNRSDARQMRELARRLERGGPA